MHQNQQLTINNSQETRPFTHEYAGGHFKLTTKGIFFIGNDKEGNPLPPRWISSPLHVVAKTRDGKSGGWGRLLEWQDDDKVTHQWAMPLALLQGDSIDVRRELARLGLSISPSKSARNLLASYLQAVDCIKAHLTPLMEEIGQLKSVHVRSNYGFFSGQLEDPNPVAVSSSVSNYSC